MKFPAKIIFLFLLIAGLSVLLIPQFSFAQEVNDFGVNDLTNVNLGTRELKDIIALIINIFLGFLGVIAVGFTVYGGYLLMTAGGEKDKTADGKKIITNALIGLAVILSAYAITAFIFSRLSDATGVSPGQPGGPGGDGDGGGGGQGIFRVVNIQPRGQLRIRNVVAQVNFNQVINPALVGENNVLTNQEGIRVERSNGQGGFERVAGTLTINPNNRQRVLFTPQANCPEPNQQLFCFGYDEDNQDLNLYRVTVLSEARVSLRSVGGLSVTCDGNSCSSEFRIGNLVDTENPEVDFTEAVNRAGQHFDLTERAIFSLDEVYQLFAQARDDGGLTGVDYYVAGEFLSAAQAGEDSPLEFLAQAEWATNNLQPQIYELTARAYDAAGHQSNLSEASVLIRPAHCFNNAQDENLGETDIDCGGECGACQGDPCGQVIENQCTDPDNQICASNVCNVDSCLCQASPRIMAVNPDNGAIGNWLTIFGRGFGNSPGRILLGDVQASLPRFCQANWTDEQVIMELPAGLDLGNTQLSLVTAQGLSSNRVDFSVNDIERPGLCQLFPGQVRPGNGFTLIGYQFGDIENAEQQKSVYFGRFEQNLLASEPTWRAAAGRAIVNGRLPNLNPGQATVRVRIDGQDSNPLTVTILPEENYPTITDFEPKSGNAGQYVNIYGTDFGQYQAGRSLVTFNQGAMGSFDFPAECRADNSFWQDDRIIVKVPEGVADGAITVTRASDNHQDSTDQPFDYQADAELTPGLCSLYPREGQVGSTFDVAGEYFNNASLFLGNQNLNVRPDNENRHFTGVAVPEGARSAPVKVVRGELQSNGLDFSVIVGEPGEAELPSTYYQWQFTTCAECLVPEVVESQSCQQGLASPTPGRNSLNNFTSTQIFATFNTDMNDELFELGATVIVSSCGNAEAPAQCSAVQGLAGDFEFGQANAGEYFALNLDSALQTSAWYRVTLEGLRSQAENLAIAEPYVWYFKTRDNNEQCQITNVSVNPDQRLISNNNPVHLNDEVLYRGYPYNAENCNICPNTFTWSWDSSNQNQAEIDRGSRVNQSLMRASAVTQSPVNITAQASDNQGQSGQGGAQVEIVPRDFGILYNRSCALQPQSPSPYASAQNACVNAKIAVQFNSVMTDSLLAADALTLKQRDNNQSIPVTLDRGLNYEANGRSGLRGVIFKPDQNLQPNTWYEVMVNRNLANVDGGILVGARAWQFKTRNSVAACRFDQVLVNPGSAVLPVDQSQNYSAETVDSASCQLLQEPDNLRWSWRSENENVATVGQSNVSQNSALAKQVGETKIRAQALGVENTGQNGNLRVTFSTAGEPMVLSITSHQPVGEEVCQNALGQIRFNLGLDPATVSNSNFTVVEHGGACPRTGCPIVSSISANQNNSIISLVPQADRLWEQNTRYEIKIRGNESGIKALSGEALTKQGCSQGMNWENNSPTGQAPVSFCSWSFTVGDSACQVGAVQVEPSSATINIGAYQQWSAYASSAEGELLSEPIANWRTANANIATVDFNREGDTSLAQSRGTGEGETAIAAIIGATIGVAQITVNDILNGPAVTNVQPQDGAERVCRNALVKVDFDKLLDKQTVNQNNFKLEYQIEAEVQPQGCRQEVALQHGNADLSAAGGLIGRWLNNAAAGIFNQIWSNLFSKAQASVYWCPAQGQWLEDHSAEQSQVHFSLTQALPAVSAVRATITGGANGVKALNGMPLAGELNEDGSYSYSFATGPDVCELDFVSVAAQPEENVKDWTFTTSFDNETDNTVDNENFDTIFDADKKYTATGFSTTGQELQSIAGVPGLEWNWQWQTANQSVAALEQSGPDFMVVQAQNKNGQSSIIASAVFPANYQKPALSASAKAIVDICENRWNPSGDRNPDYKFIDPNYNFSLAYCRDYGSADFSDDLPALFTPQAINHNPDNNPAQDDLLREYLIPVPATGDVVGLRIYSNNLHLSPFAWYQKNIIVKGQAASTQIDGYEAVQDGRTVYVAGANARPDRAVFGFNNVQSSALAQAGNWLKDWWRGFRNKLLNLPVNDLLAAVDPGANQGVLFQQNRQQFNALNNQFANTGLRPNDVVGAQANLTQARANFDREALAEAGVSEEEIDAYEENLNTLAVALARYQGLISARTALQNLLAEINRLQISGEAVDNFISDFNNFNNNINEGLREDELTDFENRLEELQSAAADLTNVLNIDLPPFDPNNFGVVNLGWQAQRIESAYTNIYLLSYNQNARPQTLEIVKRLLAKWRFNSNIDNPDLKEKLRRDVKRLADLTAVSQSVGAYQGSHNNAVPALTAGTYLSGRSNSKWPSWNQTLGPALATGLPADPINKFNRCIVCTEPRLLNAGFEEEEDFTDQTGWRLVEETANSAVVGVNNNRSYIKEGNASLSVMATAAQGGISQYLVLLPNTTYELNAWVYLVSGRAHLTFWGNDYGNEWISPPDVTGWVLLKNRLVTNPAGQGGSNGPENGIFIRSHGAGAEFYVDMVSVKTAGNNCGYDRETCWNPNANQSRGAFACDEQSYFYSYQTLGNNNYLLAAKMETTADWRSDPVNPLNSHFRLSTERVLGCTTEAVGGYCGDGRVNGNEQCEPGMSYGYCPIGNRWNSPRYYGCEPPGSEFGECTWVDPKNYNDDWANLNQAQICGGSCNDRVLNTGVGNYQISPDEQCDVSADAGADGFSNGQINGSSLTNQYACSAACRDIGGWCGDNIIQTIYDEECDGNANGWSCDNGASPVCSGCLVSCPDGGAPFEGQCGDGVKQQQEACDASAGLPINTSCSNNCQTLSCVSVNYAACDGSVASGCEVDLRSDVNNCNSCGNVCRAADATPSCVARQCEFRCIEGAGACEDNNPADGCETDLYTDVNHCGACGRRCPVPAFGSATCSNQTCGIVCNQGFERQGDQCVADCGDGIIMGNEICDDGDAHNGDVGFCNNSCSGMTSFANLLFIDNFEVWDYTAGNWERGNNENNPQWSQEVRDNNQKLKFTLGSANTIPRDYRVTNGQAVNLLDTDILVQINFSYSNDDDAIIVARHNGGNDNNNAVYYALWNDYNGQIQIRRKNNGNNPGERLAQADSLRDGNYWLHFRVYTDYLTNTVKLKARWWPVGQAMPDRWNLEFDDNSNQKISNAGKVGLAGWPNTTFYFDNFQVYRYEE